jgi:hypothetical protein
MIEAGLIDPRHRIEIEVTARLPGEGGIGVAAHSGRRRGLRAEGARAWRSKAARLRRKRPSRLWPFRPTGSGRPAGAGAPRTARPGTARPGTTR